MKRFAPIEIKIIPMNSQDIVTTSEEATGTIGGNGEIIMPPDEFDND